MLCLHIIEFLFTLCFAILTFTLSFAILTSLHVQIFLVIVDFNRFCKNLRNGSMDFLLKRSLRMPTDVRKCCLKVSLTLIHKDDVQISRKFCVTNSLFEVMLMISNQCGPHVVIYLLLSRSSNTLNNPSV